MNPTPLVPSFPRKRESSDFSHVPPCSSRGKLWTSAFASLSRGDDTLSIRLARFQVGHLPSRTEAADLSSAGTSEKLRCERTARSGIDHVGDDACYRKFELAVAGAGLGCRRFPASRIGRSDAPGHRHAFCRSGGGVPRRYPRSVELLVCSRALHLFANHPGK